MSTRLSKEDYSKLSAAPSELDNIRLVLIRTFHPGNIGSVARAMKTMGLTKLHLVDPVDFPHEDAGKMAVSAEDILDKATICETVDEAISDCTVVIASTARIRGVDLPEVSPEECAQILLEQAKQNNKTAILLGPERMGLHNQHFQHATHRVTIPTSPNLGSLNLAAAAQTLSYEIYKQFSAEQDNKSTDTSNSEPASKKAVELATREDHEGFYKHLEETIKATGFIKPGHGGPIMQRLRALFARAEADKEEINILRAILASVDRLRK